MSTALRFRSMCSRFPNQKPAISCRFLSSEDNLPPFPPSRQLGLNEKLQDHGWDPNNLPSRDEVVAKLEKFIGGVERSQVRAKLDEIKKMSPKQRWDFVQKISKTFDPNNTVDPKMPRSKLDEIQRINQTKVEDLMKEAPDKFVPPPGFDELTPGDILRALNDDTFRRNFAKATGMSGERLNTMMSVFETMNKIDKSGGVADMGEPQMAEAQSDMQRIMKMIREDKLEKPIDAYDTVDDPEFSEKIKQANKDRSKAAADFYAQEKRNGNANANLKNEHQTEAPLEDDLKTSSILEAMSKVSNGKIDDDMLKAFTAHASKEGEAKSTSSQRPVHENKDKKAPNEKDKVKFDETDVKNMQLMMEKMSDQNLGGLRRDALESFNAAFTGESASRARWLGKKPDDIRITDIAMMLADYHSLAAENVMLREQNRELHRWKQARVAREES